ncbi:MAG: hypothetical protein ABL908_20925 [Hyphomicrobium sp.]
MRRAPAPSLDDISDAIEAARNGRGLPLARLIKSFSLADLARGLARGGDGAVEWYALGTALAFASGRKSERQRCNAVLRDMRREGRTKEVRP